MKRRNVAIATLFVLVVAALGWISPVLAQASSEIKWGDLSDASPQSSLAIQKDYKAALDKTTGTWKALSNSTVAYWMVPFAGDHFKLSGTFFGLKAPFSSYLVSPALKLDDVKGEKLSFDYTTQGYKGSPKPLKIQIVDKTGKVLSEVATVEGAKEYTSSSWQAKEVTFSNDLTGVGFLAFFAEGDKANLANYMLRNIVIEEVGAATPYISVSPKELDFYENAVGSPSYVKEITVFAKNLSGAIAVSKTGDAEGEFTYDATAVTATGGKVKVSFEGKTAGDKQATLLFTADGTTAEVKLLAKATGGSTGGGMEPSEPTDEAFEVLKDNFFYEFDANDKPKHWEPKGTITKLEGSDRFNSSSQFGVGITTAKGETGFIKQVIDLSKAGEAGNKVVKEENELEGLIHYQTVESPLESGPFRLACQWLDAEGKEITQADEKSLLNNEKLFLVVLRRTAHSNSVLFAPRVLLSLYSLLR